MNGANAGTKVNGMRLGGGRVLRRRLGRPLTIAVSTLALGAAIAAPPASATAADLAGTWTSVDLDGSNQTLEIKGAGNPVLALFLADDLASQACGGHPAKLVGPAVADGNDLVMLGTLVCRPGGNPIPGTRIFYSFEYDAATDTLTDFTGVVWERVS